MLWWWWLTFQGHCESLKILSVSGFVATWSLSFLLQGFQNLTSSTAVRWHSKARQWFTGHVSWCKNMCCVIAVDNTVLTGYAVIMIELGFLWPITQSCEDTLVTHWHQRNIRWIVQGIKHEQILKRGWIKEYPQRSTTDSRLILILSESEKWDKFLKVLNESNGGKIH